MTRSDQDLAPKVYDRPLLPYSEYFGNSKILAELLRADEVRPWLTSMPKSPEEHKFLVWLGCSVIRTVHIAETLDDILRHLAVDYVTLGGPSHCCGIVHDQRNDREVGSNMMQGTLRKFDSFKPETLLFWCPSCDQHLRKAGDTQSEVTKNRISVTTFLDSQIDASRLIAPVRRKVALHWHGGGAEQEQDGAAAVSILSKIDGLEVIDMPSILNVGRHCTDTNIQRCGEATFRSVEAEWIRLAKEKGADVIGTIYHSCHREALHGQHLIPEQHTMPVVNYLAIVAEAMGLAPREDKFARFTSSGDLDAIAAELSQTAEERGINLDQMRRAIKANFARRV